MMDPTLSSVPWSIRPLATHDVFIFKVRFLAASHMVRGDVSPVFSITWLRKRSLCPLLAFFPAVEKCKLDWNVVDCREVFIVFHTAAVYS